MTTLLPDPGEAGAAAARHAEQRQREARRKVSAGSLVYSVNRHKAMARDLKDSARYVTKILIEAGRVRPRPPACERCGVKPERPELVHCHHLDYLRPELVQYLCPPCHRAEHPRPIDWQQLWDDADHDAA